MSDPEEEYEALCAHQRELTEKILARELEIRAADTVLIALVEAWQKVENRLQELDPE